MHVVEDHLHDVGLTWEDANDLEKWQKKSQAVIPPRLAPQDEHEENFALERDTEVLDTWRKEEARVSADLRDGVISEDEDDN